MDWLYSKYEKLTSRKFVIIFGIMAAATGLFMFGFFDAWFESQAGRRFAEVYGVLSPSELYEIATAYGQSGRELYLLMSITLDTFVPIVMFLCLASLSIFLVKQLTDKIIYGKVLLLLSFVVSLADLLENYFIRTVMRHYPLELHTSAALAGTMTALKMSMGVLFAVILVVLVILVVRKKLLLKKAGN